MSDSDKSSLPKWIRESSATGYETKDAQTIWQLLKAISIAWEALDEISGSCYHSAKTVQNAMRRINELGNKGE